MPDDTAIDLSTAAPTEFREKLGQLVQASLLRSSACIVLARGTRELTFVDPSVLDSIPDVDMAEALLGAWSDGEIEAFLSARAARRGGARG